jgi:hypothetical protein
MVLFSQKDNWNSVICSKMDETGGHYVQWNQSHVETEKYRLESRIVITRYWEGCREEEAWKSVVPYNQCTLYACTINVLKYTKI